MHLFLEVEDLSTEESLRILLPKLGLSTADFNVYSYGGKSSMLTRLPDRLRAHRHSIQQDTRILIVLDQDRDDCLALKARIVHMLSTMGIVHQRHGHAGATRQAVVRLAIEELEAWFFGDNEALCRAYPKIPRNLSRRSAYRDPDTIGGGTWEALERVLKHAGYYSTGMPKIEVARNVSTHMDPERNTSRSFQNFRDAVRELMQLH
jgi:hypothetical protein